MIKITNLNLLITLTIILTVFSDIKSAEIPETIKLTHIIEGSINVKVINDMGTNVKIGSKTVKPNEVYSINTKYTDKQVGYFFKSFIAKGAAKSFLCIKIH